MKKVIFILALAFALHSIPTKVSAIPVAIDTPGGFVALAVIGTIAVGENKADAKAPATGDEFVDLNNTKSFTSLMDQKAGGSKNTLDILQ